MSAGKPWNRRVGRIINTLWPLCLLFFALVACTATEPLPTLVPTSPPIIIPTEVVAVTLSPIGSPTTLPPTPVEGTVIAELSPTAVLPTAAPTAAPATATLLPTLAPPTAPPPTAAGGSLPQCSRPAGWVLYIVQRGDTVGSLAACSGASVAQIADANCLASADVILAGQPLWLPRLCVPPPADKTQPTDTPPIPTAGPPQPGPATVQVNKRNVTYGESILIKLGNFHPGSTITITFNPRNDQNIVLDRQHVTADAMGGFELSYPIPLSFPLERIFVRARDNAANPQLGADFFTVVPPTATSTLTPTPAETLTDTPTAPPTDSPAPSETPTLTPPPSETPTEAPPPSETPTLEPSLTPTDAPAPG